jgi:Zn-dependent protease with chaperone function
MKITVESKQRPFMYVSGSTIHVSYGYLETSSDSHLQAAINHEIGHIENRYTPLALIILSGFLFLVFSCAYSALLPFTPGLYPLFCFYLRQGEFFADSYAFSIDPSSTLELLRYEGLRMDNRFIDNSILYLFRFHPSYIRRVKNLNKEKDKVKVE